MDSATRRKTLDGIKRLNELTLEELGDPETLTRIQQYEMAYRMQTSVPELTDINSEPESTFKLYGEAAKNPVALPTPPLWRGDWWNAASVLFKSTTTTGTPMPMSLVDFPISVEMSTNLAMGLSKISKGKGCLKTPW